MTGPIRSTLEEREFDSFRESPTRAGKTAVEVYLSNPGDISGGGSSSVNLKTEYSEISSVVSGVTSTLLSHVFGLLVQSKIRSVSVAGDNIATYEMFIDSNLIEKKRTYFGGSLNENFDFSQGLSVGLGSTLEIKVYHLRPSVGSFSATLKYSEGL